MQGVCKQIIKYLKLASKTKKLLSYHSSVSITPDVNLQLAKKVFLKSGRKTLVEGMFLLQNPLNVCLCFW